MKKALLLLILLFIAGTKGFAQGTPDSTAIKETVANYIEGWYSADADRMAKALHPELAKRGIRQGKEGQNTQIMKADFNNMVAWTKGKPNEIKANPAVKNTLSIIIREIGKNIADVKCVSPDFIDYLHLGRINGEWKILNAIWEPAK